MRDIALFIALFALLPVALKRPMVGIATYIVISIMNPHQLSWSAARDFPWAMIYAVVITISAATHHGDRFSQALRLYRWPLVLLAWTVVTTVLALDLGVSLPFLIAFAKVQYGVIIALVCMRDMRDVRIVVGALALSVGLYGFKGFVFMLATAGSYRVNGPSNTTIGDNNQLALALAMTVPLLYWLASQASAKWTRVLFWTVLVGCIFSTFGTYSRGGFLALGIVAVAMLARSPRKLQIFLLLLPVMAIAVSFMPDAFWDRMHTIDDYKEDGSAMGRIHAWMTALNIANDRLTGAGFSFYQNPMNYIAYSPPNPFVRTAHSIYFQTLGEHGWIGLALFLTVYLGAMRKTFAGRRRFGAGKATSQQELMRALQISLLAYLIGGAFLSQAFWDFAFYLYAVVVMVHAMPIQQESGSSLPENQTTSRPSIFGVQPAQANHT